MLRFLSSHRTSLLVVAGSLILHLFLQSGFAHRHTPFVSPEPTANLTAVLTADTLSPWDYDLLFRQTGLSPAAVDGLLSWGEGGKHQILAMQSAFLAPRETTCKSLIPFRVTCQERLEDTPPSPLAPVEPGDILVTFSTHTEGWRHGHAALALGNGEVLEATQLGADSHRRSLANWRTYPTLLILRVRGATATERAAVVDFAKHRLDGAPYNLFSGLGRRKTPPSHGPISVQCAYLPWCAWAQAGYDLDGDGGHVVTVTDLAESPLLDVVQVVGLDPALFSPAL